MKAIVLLIVMGTLIAGCAPKPFVRGDVPLEKFNVDIDDCAAEKQRMLYSIDDTGESIQAANRMYSMCMRAKGYKRAQ